MTFHGNECLLEIKAGSSPDLKLLVSFSPSSGLSFLSGWEREGEGGCCVLLHTSTFLLLPETLRQPSDTPVTDAVA